MAFEDLGALARELGARADEAADAAFNAQHALAVQERAASQSITAAVAEQHRREQLSDDVAARSFPARGRGGAGDDDRADNRDDNRDDDAPGSWLR